MLIDFHTHIFPDKIAERAVKSLEANIHSRGMEGKAVIDATLCALKKSMRDNGVDISVVLPIATTLTQSKSINSFAERINGHDGIISFGSLHPMQENWEIVLLHIKSSGLLGIKLHPEYQNFYIDSPQSIRVLKKCEELDLITVLHTGNDIGIEPPVHCMPERLSHVLEYVSGSKLVAAHLGGWRAWDDAEKYLAGTPVYFDTSYTVDFIEKSQLLRIIRTHGSEKILCGSDSPWEKQGHSAALIRSLPLTESELDNIFYKNAKKLLKIG